MRQVFVKLFDDGFLKWNMRHFSVDIEIIKDINAYTYMVREFY
jgi:hypothetical protein